MSEKWGKELSRDFMRTKVRIVIEDSGTDLLNSEHLMPS